MINFLKILFIILTIQLTSSIYSLSIDPTTTNKVNLRNSLNNNLINKHSAKRYDDEFNYLIARSKPPLKRNLFIHTKNETYLPEEEKDRDKDASSTETYIYAMSSSRNVSSTFLTETDNFFKLKQNFLYSHYQHLLAGVLLYSLTIWTIIGNIFVCIAILTNKQLKQGGMSNFLIGNLALSDLLLGITVLPFSATLTTFKSWLFGKILCDLWLSIDVLCSTASIWGLLVIALDRYIATNHPIRYRKQKNSIKIAILYCTISWLISITISLGPLIFVGSDDDAKKSGLKQMENSTEFECVLFQTPSYVILSSLFSFYLPLVLMFILYTGVFLRIRQQSKLFKNKPKDLKQAQSVSIQSSTQEVVLEQNNNKKRSIKQRPQAHQTHNSEAKITKTLAIIMGVFVACYLPFFTIYIIRSQLSNPDSIPGYVMEIFLWLGYFNSALNPILYAILNQNFRIAFKDILTCQCFKRNNSQRAFSASYRLQNSTRTVKRVHLI